ncbi:diguanylate cyclase [Alphaproteobacteria bacterium HT1-32]|nr:diguanylate cyclase [Alphaproteobacteria bacterium HT1-32]
MVSNDIENRLAKLRQDYTDTISEKIGIITAAWQALLGGGEKSPVVMANIRYHAHRLAGGAGSFGFTQLGAVASGLEEAVTPLLEKPRLSNIDHDRISERIALLREAAASIADPETTEGPEKLSDHIVTNTLLQVGDLDSDTTEALGNLGSFGYSVVRKSAAEVEDGLEDIDNPTAILIDISLLDYGAGVIEQLTDRNNWRATPPPLIILSDHDDFKSRLKALRCGSNAFLVWPVTDVDIVDTLDRLSPPSGQAPIRVLIIDDDASLADYYTMILEAAGMECRSITDPTEVLVASTEFDPEMIVTDLYMPICSGDEMAGTLRQKEEFDGVPIIFLSGEHDIDAQFLALRRGADDFLNKPVSASDLVSAVTTRARRFRNLRARISQDSLTGLLNHTTIKQRLEVEISRSVRTGQPMSFALIDIDHFKQVNDSYGHPTGDRVIKTLSRMLVQRLRKTDIVGRYGGEEFAAVLPGADLETARKILDDFRESFSQVAHNSSEGTFTCSFSCGVAEFRSEDQDLTEIADEAMYKAKQSGRNRVVAADN